MSADAAVIVALMLSILGKIFSRQHFEIFFLFIPEKQDLNFDENSLHSTGDNLFEISKPEIYTQNTEH